MNHYFVAQGEKGLLNPPLLFFNKGESWSFHKEEFDADMFFTTGKLPRHITQEM